MHRPFASNKGFRKLVSCQSDPTALKQKAVMELMDDADLRIVESDGIDGESASETASA